MCKAGEKPSKACHSALVIKQRLTFTHEEGHSGHNKSFFSIFPTHFAVETF
jgi:hypothetical protein